MLSACGRDDGDSVRDATDTSAASGSGSGTGLSSSDLSETDNELVNAAVDQYKHYVEQQVDALVVATTTFTNAVRAGDVEAAKAAYAPSRVSWERIEPIAGLSPTSTVPPTRVDDFDVDDGTSPVAPPRVPPVGETTAGGGVRQASSMPTSRH